MKYNTAVRKQTGTYLSNALRAGAECTDAMHAKNTKINKRQFEF